MTAMDVALEPVVADPPGLGRPAIMSQRWAELAYFHWPYDPAVVQALLPEGLTVDVFDGVAWVGLIPFEMRNVKLGPIPAPGLLGNFIEINVRTYVHDRWGRRGVWFFSLDVPRSPIVAVAQSVFALPYRWAAAGHDIEGERHRYWLARRRLRSMVPLVGDGRPRPRADIAFTVGDRLPADEVGELDHFLSARWALFTKRGERLLRGRVDHGRWPLRSVEDVAIDQNVMEAAGLPSPSGAPRALYSPGVNVRLAWLEPVR